MNKKYFKIIFAVSIMIGISNISQVQAGWFGKPVKGQIIDKETKKPIKDVIVIATWNKKHWVEPINTGKMLDAKEVLTDDKGMFDFKTKTGIMPGRQVHLYFYKKGYEFGGFCFFNEGKSFHSLARWGILQRGVFEMEKLPEGEVEVGFRTAIRRSIDYRYENISGEKPYKFAEKIPKTIEIIKSR